MMRTWLKFGLRLLVKVLSIGLLVFLILIHPNDWRLNLDFSADKPEIVSNFRRVSSLWQKNIDVSFEGLSDSVASDLKNIVEKWPSTIFLDLKRFNYSNQVFLTVGRYPQHLEGRDALYIPNSGSLNLRIQGSALHRLEFGFVGTQLGDRVEVSIGGKKLKDISNNHSAFSSFLGQWISPWIWPNILLVHQRWEDSRFDFEVEQVQMVNIRCKSEGLGCFVSGLDVYEQSTVKKKQVVVVLVDTMRFDAIDAKRTPQLSRLKENSISFIHAVSPGNMTSPSTNAFLSCTAPTFLGSWAFSYGVSTEQRAGFSTRAEKSFPNQLAVGGLKTAMIGNISVLSEVMGVGQNHGFEQQQSIEFDGYDTPIIAYEAQKWIADNEDRSFLLYLHFNAPHAPNRPPLRDIYEVWPTESPFRSYPSMLDTLYDAELLYTDRYLSKFVDFLQRRKLFDDMTFIVSSDHGDQMKPRLFPGNQIGASPHGSYHDHGATLLNDEIRVPLLLKLPKTANVPPSEVSRWVSTLQIGPTLIGQLPGSLRKECLLPELPLGESGGDFPVLPIEGFRERAILYENRWKYIRAYSPTNKRVYKVGGFRGQMTSYYKKEQLYDLKADPFEFNDLSQTESTHLEEARKVYRQEFGLRTGYELVIENPLKQAVSVILSEAAVIKEALPQFVSLQDRIVQFAAGLSERYIIRFYDLGLTMPIVRVGGHVFPLLYTRDRLALSPSAPNLLEVLPFEESGENILLPISSQPNVYLRKLWDIEREEMAIQNSNPEFEKMLREWGYLNDN